MEVPYWKNYDGKENPYSWPKNFDTNKWGFFVAVENNEYVGGAVVAYQTPEIRILEGKNDITVLWDIRLIICPAGHTVEYLEEIGIAESMRKIMISDRLLSVGVQEAKMIIWVEWFRRTQKYRKKI